MDIIKNLNGIQQQQQQEQQKQKQIEHYSLEELVDLIEKMFNLNIVIINEENKIECNKTNNNYSEYIILLKNKKNFEIIVRGEGFNEVHGKNSSRKKKNITGNINKFFDKQDSIIKFLLKYYTESCENREMNFPENYHELQLPSYITIFELFCPIVSVD